MGFVLKCKFILDPMRMTIYNFIIFSYLYSMMIRIFEKPLHDYRLINGSVDGWSVDNPYDAFYLVIITILTVGYGDITCRSAAGRTVCCITAIHGALIVSFVVASGSELLNLNHSEAKVAYKIKSC